ncbi:hypothetical protein DBR06_SOUSAS43810001, partial [Sousa chinensis]
FGSEKFISDRIYIHTNWNASVIITIEDPLTCCSLEHGECCMGPFLWSLMILVFGGLYDSHMTSRLYS